MRYEIENNRCFRVEDDGTTEQMCNFVASIVKEVKFVDGLTSRSVLTITGVTPDPENDAAEPIPLPPVEVPAEDFPSLNWVLPNWGVRCVIRPGSGIKDDLRACIQLNSRPEQVTVYKHTGWTTLGGQRAYLHAGGAIKPAGNDPTVTVRVPPELSRYDLTTAVNGRDGVNATLGLLKLGPPELMWPLIAGTLAPLYGDCDFAVHVAGRTGTFKSEVTSLLQSHYGPTMDARHLPGSWSSTANALEALAFFAKNAVFVIDDFVPHGTSWQQRAYQSNADKIIRAQGNQAGRSRLSDTSTLQATMYPRGMILSSGEDIPEGHSVRARMLVLEIAPEEISVPALTASQQARGQLVGTTAWLAQELAKSPPDLRPRVEQLRDAYREIGHSRTPAMLGRLVAGTEHFLNTAAGHGFIGESDRKHKLAEAKSAIEAAGARQNSYLEDADPVDQFGAALRDVLARKLGHFRTLNGGIPMGAALLGWTEEKHAGEMTTFKPHGPVVGWVKTKEDELYLDVNAGWAVVKKAAGNEIALSKQTLIKRLKEAGVICRNDESRERNTVRVQAEGHPRQVLCLSLSTILDTKEIEDDGSES